MNKGINDYRYPPAWVGENLPVSAGRIYLAPLILHPHMIARSILQPLFDSGPYLTAGSILPLPSDNRIYLPPHLAAPHLAGIITLGQT